MSQEVKLKWKCLECKSKQPKFDNTNTPVRSAHQSKIEEESDTEYLTQECNVTIRRNRSAESYITEDRLKEILKSEIKKELEAVLEVSLTRLVRTQLNDINNRITEFQQSMTYISGQYEELKTLMGTTSSVLQSLKEENRTLKEDIGRLTSRIKVLEDDYMKQQQWSRLQNIEITGVPECKEEDNVNIVQKLSQYIGVPIETSDIEFAHRVQPRRAGSSTCARPIIARLRQRSVKDRIMAAARKTRNLNAGSVGIGGENCKIYVNEHLTRENKMLLSSCKQKGKELNYKYIWTKNCRIFVRKNDTSPPIPITTTSDLVKIV